MLENTEIKEYLEKLLSTWNQEKADAFHSNCTRDDTEGRYIWNYDENVFSRHKGVTIHRDVTAIHISLTGTVYKLTKQWQFTEHDWPAFLQLHKLSQKSKDFRTEIPIENEIIMNPNDDDLFFSVVQRPCHQVGLDFQYDIFENNVDEKYFIEYIDQAVILFKNLKTVVDSIPNCGFPEVGIPPTKRLKDEEGYFWADFKKWNTSELGFRDRMKNDLNSMLFYLEYNLGKLDFTDTVKQYAEKQWK